MPISERSASTSVLGSWTATPCTSTSPLVASSRPLRHLRNVLLPEPDGPMTHTTSEAMMEQSIPRSTGRSPKCLVSPLTRITSSIASLQLLDRVGQPQRQHPIHERDSQVGFPISRIGTDRKAHV